MIDKIRRDRNTSLLLNREVNREMKNMIGKDIGMVSKIGCGAMLFILSIWFGLMCAMATWTDRTLEFWLSYWCDKTVIIDWWLSCLASLLLPFVFVANVVSEIAMKCV